MDLSGPGIDVKLKERKKDKRTLGFTLRTWVSGPRKTGTGFQDLESSPSYGRLIFFSSLFSASTVTFLLRPVFPSLFSASVRPSVRAGSAIEKASRWSVIGRAGSAVENASRTPSHPTAHGLSEFIYKIDDHPKEDLAKSGHKPDKMYNSLIDLVSRGLILPNLTL
jgi:hypothetical protein